MFGLFGKGKSSDRSRPNPARSRPNQNLEVDINIELNLKVISRIRKAYETSSMGEYLNLSSSLFITLMNQAIINEGLGRWTDATLERKLQNVETMIEYQVNTFDLCDGYGDTTYIAKFLKLPLGPELFQLACSLQGLRQGATAREIVDLRLPVTREIAAAGDNVATKLWSYTTRLSRLGVGSLASTGVSAIMRREQTRLQELAQAVDQLTESLVTLGLSGGATPQLERARTELVRLNQTAQQWTSGGF